jgi:hypothetical protein
VAWVGHGSVGFHWSFGLWLLGSASGAFYRVSVGRVFWNVNLNGERVQTKCVNKRLGIRRPEILGFSADRIDDVDTQIITGPIGPRIYPLPS